jgi:Cytochrome P450
VWNGTVRFVLAREEFFGHDRLTFLRTAFSEQGDVLRLPSGQICVAEPVMAKAILGNVEGHYQDHSDFFSTTRGVFGPRSAQVAIGLGARELLARHLEDNAEKLPGLIAERLGRSSWWPDTGNALLFDHLVDAFVAPGRFTSLQEIVYEYVERSVLVGGAPERMRATTKALFRRRVMGVLRTAVKARRAAPRRDPVDLLDVVVRNSPPESSEDMLAEVYLSFVSAAMGSTGFALGWSLYLLGTHPDVSAEPGWVVREALRLWPPSWIFYRQPVRPHVLAGVPVHPGQEVVVCSLLAHRHPAHWVDPDEFRPQRWAGAPGEAYLPFGWGPHACAGVTVVYELIEDILRILTAEHRISVAPLAPAVPYVGAMLAPPPFVVRLVAPAARRSG